MARAPFFVAFLLAVTCLGGAFVSGAAAQSNEDCLACHSRQDTTPPVDLSLLRSSVHGSIECVSCHSEASTLPHPERMSPVNCGGCHADAVKTYDQSYHGLAARYGSTKVANCASCHGYHDIMLADDPASSVNRANISATCGKCHPGAGPRLAGGYVHSDPVRSKNTVVRYVIVFYLVLICLVIGGMFAHNLIDFAKKFADHFRITKSRASELRFVLSERLQLVALAVVFFVLAYSGFARRFPDAWWSSPFRLFDNPSGTRGMIHRIAAAVFIALCVYHVWFVSLTRRGRKQLSELKPGFRDFRDLYSVARYNTGASAAPPQFGRYSYIEKSEYWALVWGSTIMIITGLALVFVNFTLKYFPLWVAELVTSIHFYEAVLATLAMLVWHFYWTIFDPHVYPMNWSWITGRTTEKRSEERTSGSSGKKPEAKQLRPGKLEKSEPEKPTPEKPAESAESGQVMDGEGVDDSKSGGPSHGPTGPARRAEGSE
ncbi:MAG: cytochrome b/b6 domain-containing protein [Candidatus Eisenbacteria bacterium]|nr:cytochrome b/b6 domain-containing protein [Candidatus Eisenbacteria bacterium]